MLVNNEEGSHLLFIMPFVNHTTMLYYKNGKKVIYNDTVKKFLLKKIHAHSFTSPVYLYGQTFIATCSPRNPHCVWVNISIIKEHNFYQVCLSLQQYNIDVDVDKLVKTYIKVIKKLT